MLCSATFPIPLEDEHELIDEGLADDIGTLIDPDAAELDPKKADTAIFYSINNM